MIDFREPLVRVHDAPQGEELLVFVWDQDSILMDRWLVGEDVRIPQRAVAKILVRRSSIGYVHQNERYQTITDLRIKRQYWRLIEDAFSR
ncbi:hypothetical protein E1J53_0015760 [Lewinella sp. W8]|nr:hypothetical protein [Lewinella sp. W8]